MKMRIFLLGLLTIVLVACDGKNGSAPESAEAAGIKTFDDSLSYALGTQLGMSARRDSLNINFDVYEKGFQAGKDSTNKVFTDSVLQVIYSKFQEKMQGRQMAAQQAAEQQLELKSKELAKTNVTFLAENKNKPGVKVTKSGLQYQVLKEGTGSNVKPTDILKVKFVASFSNGEVFDSMAKNQVIDFPARGLFPGWDEASQLMKKGGKYKFVFPPEIAFRDRAAGPIPPNSVIIFDMELIDKMDNPVPGGVNIQPAPPQQAPPPPQPR
jgi:FKBP-type peptidyl-prolyl cis-trans isomerase